MTTFLIIIIFRLPNLNSKDIHLSYLPLAHIYERIAFWGIFSLGASVGLFNGEVSKIKDDLDKLKPTLLISVPRLYNRYADLIKMKFEKKSGIKGELT